MMKLTNSLLQQAAKAAWRQATLQAKLTDAFNERYGCTYSDVDADDLIEPLDYGGGTVPTLADCDRIMSDRGFPPRIGRAAPADGGHDAERS